MTHDVAAHIHQADPPRGGSAPNSVWNNDALIDRLKELWETLPAREVATKLSAEFNTSITRSAVIGKVHRLGLTVNDKKELHPQTRIRTGKAISQRPTLRIINGGNNSKVLIETVEGDVAPLRTIPLAPLNLTLDQVIEVDGCRYIAGSDHLFCGHPKRKGSSFCTGHHQIVWIPATDRNQRARGMR